ncbi:hypothetical protein ACIQPQ_02915 [Streptomyces sp. NPDC091281]|uniref:hypothetical protein n=1 Tax=Streptomyces sp. NPDC091281 TaxID=3365985 RepID=UPI003825A9B4
MAQWRLQMLIPSGRPSQSARAVRGGATFLLLAALSTSCGLTPEHPGDDALLLGFRVTPAGVEVKVPVCPGDELSRVEVWDPGSDTRKERLLWWGDAPSGADAADGLLRLWSSVGYRKVSATGIPAGPLPLVDVSVTYRDQEDSVGDLVDLSKAADSSAGDKYWTIKGDSVTAREVDEQLSCPADQRQ